MSAAGEVVVRDARPEEADVLRDLTLRAYGEFATVMEPSAWDALHRAVQVGLRDGSGAERIVAERDGSIVGTVTLYPPAVDAYGGEARRAEWPELRLLAVAPEARGAGVGKALVEECVRRARRMGAGALGLHTSRSMTVAIAIYRQFGFERVPAHDFQPPGAELVEAYRLPLTREEGAGGG